jgi:tRNA modification GTPase
MTNHDQDPSWTNQDTIVAVATPPGEGGLAVVRMSGARAVEIANAVFRNREFHRDCRSHRAYYGAAVWPESKAGGSFPGAAGRQAGALLDDVVALPMLAPRSYTGEDTVEFFCHGGRVTARVIVEACQAAGARAAGPGEFTRRAFLNGRLSLDQAEAVADLIRAEDELAAAAALEQLRGGLDRELTGIEKPLRDLLAELEGSLEFSEHEEIAIPQNRIAGALAEALTRLRDLSALSVAGRYLRRGVHVVLLGAPNVGKSSLLNALLGRERVLVDHEPGTTRDVVSETITRDDCRFIFFDTAGLRREAGRVEAMGIEKTLQVAADADIVLALQEAPAGPEAEDGRPVDAEAVFPCPVMNRSGCVVLPVWTKIDLVQTERDHVASPGGEALPTSAVKGWGLEELWLRIQETVDRERMRQVAAMGVFLNDRHRDKLGRCEDQLRELQDLLQSGDPGQEVIATLLATTLAELGEVSGRVFTENLLDDVFSRFCVGK